MTRQFREIDWEGDLPNCDFCVMKGAHPVKPAPYDGPTIHGPWANMCHTHMLTHAPKSITITKRRKPQ